MERYGDVSHVQFGEHDEDKDEIPVLRDVMRKMYMTLVQNPDSEIIVIDSLDGICRECPNSDGNKCVKYPRLDDVDNEAATNFGVILGKPYTAKELARRLRK